MKCASTDTIEATRFAVPETASLERGRRVTLRDLARELSVSVTTISRGLRDDPGIGEATRLKIKELAGRWNYRPNAAGAALSTGRTLNILFVVPYSLDGFPHLFHMEVLEGLAEEVSGHGYTVDLVFEKTLRRRKQSVPEVFQYAHADAGVLLLMRTDEPTELRQGFPIPVVLVNQRIDGPVVDSDGPVVDSVVADDQRGGYLATEHLVAEGHCSIAHVTGPGNISSIAERRKGYESALRRHGLWSGDGLISTETMSKAGGYRATKRLLRHGARFTALFCGMDLMAIGAMQALTERGLHVPEDVSVVGFDDDVFAPLINPPLTTIRKPRYDMGRSAGRMLLKRLKGTASAKARCMTLKTKLIERASVRTLAPLVRTA